MEGFVRGDIVVVEFPYSNLKIWKRRPALIIKVPEGEDILICQLTAESYEKSVEIPIRKNDFQQGELKKESYLRIDKIASIEKFLAKYKVGSLKQIKFEEIVDKICNYLKT